MKANKHAGRTHAHKTKANEIPIHDICITYSIFNMHDLSMDSGNSHTSKFKKDEPKNSSTEGVILVPIQKSPVPIKSRLRIRKKGSRDEPFGFEPFHPGGNPVENYICNQTSLQKVSLSS